MAPDNHNLSQLKKDIEKERSIMQDRRRIRYSNDLRRRIGELARKMPAKKIGRELGIHESFIYKIKRGMRLQRPASKEAPLNLLNIPNPLANQLCEGPGSRVTITTPTGITITISG